VLGNGDDLAVNGVTLTREHDPILGEEFDAGFRTRFTQDLAGVVAPASPRFECECFVAHGYRNPGRDGTFREKLQLFVVFGFSRCFDLGLCELPAFGFHEVLGMLLAVLGFPIVASQLTFDDDLLAFLS